MYEGPTWVVVYRASARAVDERALVLRAVGVAHQVHPAGGSVLLLVPLDQADRALNELAAWEAENRGWPPRDELPPMPPGALASAAVYASLLISAFVLERGDAFGLAWFERGMADAAAMRDGEWWRAATALSLHSDLAHLAGNLLFGALFGVLFAQLVGNGVAWAATLLAGFLGNLANALLQMPDHRSVGASTAVFGALGCLVAYEWRRRALLRLSRVRRLAPPILGLVMLGWFGTSGERTDVGAHLTGMAAGGVIGALIGVTLALRKTTEPFGAVAQNVAGTAAALAVPAAWWIAFR